MQTKEAPQFEDEDDYSEESDGAQEDRDQNAMGEQAKKTHRRRSKNDNEGRTYQCGCGKSYLSYPALYTHIK